MKNERRTLRAALYVRTSTLKQEESIKLQEQRLRYHCKSKLYEVYNVYKDEGLSGATMEIRDDLKRMMNDVEKKRFDVIIVTHLDRFARSTKDLLSLIERINIFGVKLATLDQPIDTTTPEGELFVTMLGAIAEFEKKLILTRLSIGRDNAKEKGKNIHRKRKDIPLKKLEEYLKKGLSANAISKILDVSTPVIIDRATNDLGYKWELYRWVKKDE